MVPDEDPVCLTDAPLPMELHEYRQFTYKRFTVNAHKCFSVCFAPRGEGGSPPAARVYTHPPKQMRRRCVSTRGRGKEWPQLPQDDVKGELNPFTCPSVPSVPSVPSFEF